MPVMINVLDKTKLRAIEKKTEISRVTLHLIMWIY